MKEQHIKALRIVYMGTPEFAVPALSDLIESRHEVVGVVTNPDRPKGRHKKPQFSPVKVRALKASIPVFQPKSFRKEPEAIEVVRAWKPDLVVVAAYGSILPQALLDVPTYGCLNIHASLLPEYRGAAPINWCIVRGEELSGVTIMMMEAGLDTGPMLASARVPIAPMDTAQDLHDVLSLLGGALLLEVMDGLLAGSIEPVIQEHGRATWAPMMKKEDGRIDWSKSAREVCDLIRGFFPWPGAFTMHALNADDSDEPCRRVKVHLARLSEAHKHHDAAPGQVLSVDTSLVVACGKGAVSLLRLQAPGKKSMDVRDFLNGFDVSLRSQFL